MFRLDIELGRGYGSDVERLVVAADVADWTPTRGRAAATPTPRPPSSRATSAAPCLEAIPHHHRFGIAWPQYWVPKMNGNATWPLASKVIT